jgi:hypothetical protein
VKDPCGECAGHCSSITSKENCWKWIAYDRDKLTRENKKLKRLIVGSVDTFGLLRGDAGERLRAAAARIAEEGKHGG